MHVHRKRFFNASICGRDFYEKLLEIDGCKLSAGGVIVSSNLMAPI